MKKIMSFILIMCVCLSVNLYADASAKSGTATALFLAVPADARSSAMGEAGTALGDDVSVLFWNPGGLANIKNLEFIFTHASHLSDFNYNFLAGAFSLKGIGSIGLGLNYIGTDPIKRYKADGEPDTEQPYIIFQDMAFNASYARKINDFISAGATAKYISQTLIDKSYTCFAADVGVFLGDKFVKNLFTGAAVKNLGSAPAFGGESDSLPFQISIGALYDLSLSGSLASKTVVDINLPNYYDMSFGIGEEIGMAFGQNFALYPRVGIKIPFEQGFLSGLTLGIGMKFLNYNVDYSFLNYGEDLQSTHKLSILYKSLGIVPEEEEKEEEVSEEEEIKTLIEEVKEEEGIEVPVEEEPSIEEGIDEGIEEIPVEEEKIEEGIEEGIEEEIKEETPAEEETSIEDDMDKLLEE